MKLFSMYEGQTITVNFQPAYSLPDGAVITWTAYPVSVLGTGGSGNVPGGLPSAALELTPSSDSKSCSLAASNFAYSSLNGFNTALTAVVVSVAINGTDVVDAKLGFLVEIKPSWSDAALAA